MNRSLQTLWQANVTHTTFMFNDRYNNKKKAEGGKSSIDKVRDLLGRKMDDKKGEKKEIPFRLSSCVLRHTVHDGGASTIQQANQGKRKEKKRNTMRLQLQTTTR
jgi:hypothetical protein